MKNLKMKKVLIIVASLLIGMQAHAQLVTGAGYLHNIESTKSKEGRAMGDAAHLNGFYLGASYNLAFGQYFGVAPGLYLDMLFQSKNIYEGSPFGGVPVGGSFSSNYTEVALSLPVNLTGQYEIGNNISILAFAGPTFRLGLMARSTYNASASIGPIHGSTSDAYDHYGDKGDTNRFNILLGGGVGVQVGDIQFLLGYDHTLLNATKFENFTTGRHQIKAGINFAF